MPYKFLTDGDNKFQRIDDLDVQISFSIYKESPCVVRNDKESLVWQQCDENLLETKTSEQYFLLARRLFE